MGVNSFFCFGSGEGWGAISFPPKPGSFNRGFWLVGLNADHTDKAN